MFSGIERKLCLRVWYKVFLSKTFGLTMLWKEPKKNRWRDVYVSEKFCYGRNLSIRMEGVPRFSGKIREVFVLQCRKMS